LNVHFSLFTHRTHSPATRNPLLANHQEQDSEPRQLDGLSLRSGSGRWDSVSLERTRHITIFHNTACTRSPKPTDHTIHNGFVSPR
jgi:hypothetical protein